MRNVTCRDRQIKLGTQVWSETERLFGRVVALAEDQKDIVVVTHIATKRLPANEVTPIA